MNKSVNKVIEYFKNQNLTLKTKEENNGMFFFHLKYRRAFYSGKLAIILISVMNKYSNSFVQMSSPKVSDYDRMEGLDR